MAPTAAASAIASPLPTTTRTAARSGGAPPRRAPSTPSRASATSDATTTTAGMRAPDGTDDDRDEWDRGRHRERAGRHRGRLHRTGTPGLDDAELVAEVGGERVGAVELERDLTGERGIEAAAPVDRGELVELALGLGVLFAPLARDVGPLGVALAAHRVVLAGGHRHRAGGHAREPGDDDRRPRRVGRRDTDQQRGDRHDAVAGAEHRGAQPADAPVPVPFGVGTAGRARDGLAAHSQSFFLKKRYIGRATTSHDADARRGIRRASAGSARP